MAGLLLGLTAPLYAQDVRCEGTLLELTVVEQRTNRTDRFQFFLRLKAQASSKTEALNELKRRLVTVRSKISGLSMGRLVVSAPRTHTIGSNTTSPQRHQATASITGEVARPITTLDTAGWMLARCQSSGNDIAVFNRWCTVS
jgi:hypothetical protein